MIKLKRGTVLLMCIAACSCAYGQIPATAVEHAIVDTLHAMNVQAVIAPGSLRFEQGGSRRRFGNADLVVERATISGSQMESRLHCKPLTACLPFYATASVRFENEAVVQRSWYGSTRRNSLRQTATKPGESVVFIREENGVRLLMRAVALQRSYEGEMTSVRAIDGRHEVMRGRASADHVVRSDP